MVGLLAAGVLLVGGVHRPRAPGAGADAADPLLPLPRLLGRERGDLLHLRLALRRRLLLRPDAADGARLRPLDAGLRLLPWTITFITIAPVVGTLADRFGERPFMVGAHPQALGMGWVALIADPGLTYLEFVIPSVVAGIGVSMAIPAAQNSVVGSFALEDVGRPPARTA